MQALEQALEDLKGLHQKILKRPAPTLGAHSFFPFPPGVDPLRHALHEVEHLKGLHEKMMLAPRPGSWLPTADCFYAKDQLVLLIELPGVPRADLEVLVSDDECIVRGTRKPPKDAEKVEPLTLERQWGPFERRFTIPSGCRLDEIDAKLADGVLELRVPVKDVKSKPDRRIEIG